ncbi:MAG: hypothetical protein WAQ53_16065 [Thiofilum sp.]|uniref:hypothetical protein n=1 Tax=Thiofilum sp. TaxID=2212733 RepID=UPI002600D09B|nr:hypothetical protein [Thiofilum sp.]MBK8452365.1 hypothetical protein [Thiofilum sp.]
MKSTSKLSLKLLLATTLITGLGFSLPSWSIELTASSSELIIDGWVMVMPTISVDEAKGETWVKYTLPDGSYQSYPLASGEPIVEKWYKPGSQSLESTPAGLSLEYMDSIKQWYMNGGKGNYKVEDDKWVEVQTPTAPAPTNNAAATDTATDSSDASSESGFGAMLNNPITGTLPSVSTSGGRADDPYQALRSEMLAEQKKCRESQSSGGSVDQAACEKAQRLYQELTAKMSGN